jgi:hypothetical protein
LLSVSLSLALSLSLTHTHTHTTHTNTYAHKHIHTNTPIHRTQTHTQTHTHTHKHTHSQTYTHKQTHTHTYTNGPYISALLFNTAKNPNGMKRYCKNNTVMNSTFCFQTQSWNLALTKSVSTKNLIFSNLIFFPNEMYAVTAVPDYGIDIIYYDNEHICLEMGILKNSHQICNAQCISMFHFIHCLFCNLIL